MRLPRTALLLSFLFPLSSCPFPLLSPSFPGHNISSWKEATAADSQASRRKPIVAAVTATTGHLPGPVMYKTSGDFGPHVLNAIVTNYKGGQIRGRPHGSQNVQSQGHERQKKEKTKKRNEKFAEKRWTKSHLPQPAVVRRNAQILPIHFSAAHVSHLEDESSVRREFKKKHHWKETECTDGMRPGRNPWEEHAVGRTRACPTRRCVRILAETLLYW